MNNNDSLYKMVDAIFALEGFQPTDTIQKVRAAVDAGRITREAFRQEYLNYIKIHKSPSGFIESRTWIYKNEQPPSK